MRREEVVVFFIVFFAIVGILSYNYFVYGEFFITDDSVSESPGLIGEGAVAAATTLNDEYWLWLTEDWVKYPRLTFSGEGVTFEEAKIAMENFRGFVGRSAADRITNVPHKRVATLFANTPSVEDILPGIPEARKGTRFLYSPLQDTSAYIPMEDLLIIGRDASLGDFDGAISHELGHMVDHKICLPETTSGRIQYGIFRAMMEQDPIRMDVTEIGAIRFEPSFREAGTGAAVRALPDRGYGVGFDVLDRALFEGTEELLSHEEVYKAGRYLSYNIPCGPLVEKVVQTSPSGVVTSELRPTQLMRDHLDDAIEYAKSPESAITFQDTLIPGPGSKRAKLSRFFKVLEKVVNCPGVNQVVRAVPIIGMGTGVYFAYDNIKKGEYFDGAICTAGIFFDPVDWAELAVLGVNATCRIDIPVDVPLSAVEGCTRIAESIITDDNRHLFSDGSIIDRLADTLEYLPGIDGEFVGWPQSWFSPPDPPDPNVDKRLLWNFDDDVSCNLPERCEVNCFGACYGEYTECIGHHFPDAELIELCQQELIECSNNCQECEEDQLINPETGECVDVDVLEHSDVCPVCGPTPEDENVVCPSELPASLVELTFDNNPGIDPEVIISISGTLPIVNSEFCTYSPEFLEDLEIVVENGVYQVDVFDYSCDTLPNEEGVEKAYAILTLIGGEHSYDHIFRYRMPIPAAEDDDEDDVPDCMPTGTLDFYSFGDAGGIVYDLEEVPWITSAGTVTVG